MIDLTSFGVESGPPTFLEQEVVITGPAAEHLVCLVPTAVCGAGTGLDVSEDPRAERELQLTEGHSLG